MEIKRRTFNVMEALVIVAICGLGGVIFSLRDAVLTLTITTKNQSSEISNLRTELANVPALAQRVGRLEVQGEAQQLRDRAQDEALRELRQTRGLR